MSVQNRAESVAATPTGLPRPVRVAKQEPEPTSRLPTVPLPALVKYRQLVPSNAMRVGWFVAAAVAVPPLHEGDEREQDQTFPGLPTSTQYRLPFATTMSCGALAFVTKTYGWQVELLQVPPRQSWVQEPQ